MKQIKGEPWPPGETLAGQKRWDPDGVPWEGGCTGGPGTLSFFSPLLLFLSHCLKFPKRAASAGHLEAATEASR